MSFLGELTDTEKLAKRHLQKLIAEVRKGIFSGAKMDLLLTNPDEFLSEYLELVPDEDRAEVAGIIKHVIVTGFFRSQHKAGRAETAGEN